MIKALSLTWSTVKQMAFKRVQILQIGLGLLCQSYFNSIYYQFFSSKSFPQNSMALLMSYNNALKLDVISQCSFFRLRRIDSPYDYPVNYAHPFITTTFCSPKKSPQILLFENAVTTTNEHLLESSVIIFLVELSR